MAKKFYITMAIPYVNAAPHIGHALEFIQTDTIARSKRLQGFATMVVSGSDENGLKIVQAAEKASLSPQELADCNTQIFLNLAKRLSVEINTWRRGSDKKLHWPGTEKLWKLGQENGDIYKKMYGGYYCVGCEDFLTKKDLVEGKCPEHLKEPEWVEEENYFFRLSKYQKAIEQLITSNQLLIVPDTRRNEILSFIRAGLADFSISRSKARAKNWGIPIPEDASQVIYTWYDGLNIYQTAVGFGYDENLYKKWWPADLHVIGKGISRFHAVYWIGILLSAGLPIPKSIFIHGYITSEGQKMSKTLKNIVDPFAICQKYGSEVIRYYLLREIPAYGDGDFSERRLKEIYNADLANGLGNLVARVAKLATPLINPNTSLPKIVPFNELYLSGACKMYKKALDEFRFNDALAFILNKVTSANKQIDQAKPWNLKGKQLEEFLLAAISKILEIAVLLQPFLPETADKIQKQFSGAAVKSQGPLFPRMKPPRPCQPTGRTGKDVDELSQVGEVSLDGSASSLPAPYRTVTGPASCLPAGKASPTKPGFRRGGIT
jgi:methionyl-tRNA synthetase